MHIKRAKTLKPYQIGHLLRVTEATSRHPERRTHPAVGLHVRDERFRGGSYRRGRHHAA